MSRSRGIIRDLHRQEWSDDHGRDIARYVSGSGIDGSACAAGKQDIQHDGNPPRPDAEPITTPAYNDPNTLRCEDNPGLKRSYEQGCINPAVTPVLTTMSGLPYIANNIRNAFWNLRPSTLTRNKGATGANRQAACSTARMKALPPADPAIVDKSCDEYPFAGTGEGGVNAIIAWVPRAEQNSQGGLLQSFYSDNRAFDSDKFQVTLP